MSNHFSRSHRAAICLLVFALLSNACLLASKPKTTPRPARPTAASATAPSKPAASEAPGTDAPIAVATPTADNIPVVQAQGVPAFAAFREAPVSAAPAAGISQAPAADLSNVFNPFVLSPAQLERLARDGFVVTPGQEKEFFTVYERARYDNVPIFVTSDSLLHSYHLLFDKVLRTAETEHFIPLLAELNRAVLAQADAQYGQLRGTSWEEAALRTVAFVAVGSRLLDPAVQAPPYAAGLVDQELALIAAAAGIQPSAIFPYLDFGEDYTQYIPRGHYTRSEALKAYFKSMMWYGRMTFRLRTENPEAGRAETRSALLLVQALRSSQVNGRPALEAWTDLYSPTAFFVGRSDDLTAYQYISVMDEVYGPDVQPAGLADEAKLDTFIAAADRLPPPRILGMVISVADDEVAQTKGLRFMGQRFVPDAYIFRQLIYRNVSTSDNRRGLPKGLDLMAAMGSQRAYSHLEASGDTAYAKYPEQMEKMRTWLAGLSPADWTETLYNAWIYSFYPLLESPAEGYPAFMQSPAWLDKQLNTSLGSWAELKHDTILYAKQVYAEMGGGPPAPEPVPPKGYVEPVPQFFARLAALTAMTREGLASRGLLNELDSASLARLEELTRSFQVMAEKELAGQPLTDEEYNTILYYGGDLEHMVMAAADSDESDPFAPRYMDEEPQAAVVADVATDPDPDNDGAPNPSVLEEAVGRINNIHVVVPLVNADGSIQLQVAKGGVFSYYEFVWPADDRLTDEKWRGMLEAGQAPPQPDWTASFMTAQGEFSELQRAVLSFQKEITEIFWGVGWSAPDFSGPLAPFQAEFDALRAAQQYEGRQLVSSQFTSFDRQSDRLAVVTVRETWDEKRYVGEYPDYGVPPIATRGPYARQVTYTIELRDFDNGPAWVVTSAVYAGPAPEWQDAR